MANNVLTIMCVAGLALAGAGCHLISGTPALDHARITPEDLKPGDTAVITVEVKDRHGIVQRVEGR